MKSINVPASAQQVSCIGFAKDFTQGVLSKEICGFVRVKNVGDDYGHIRLNGMGGDGMAFSVGETEYVYINEGDCLEIVDGNFNIMY